MRRILICAAHADDAELGCGGTIATAIQKGNIVKVVICTSSDFTDYNHNIIRDKSQVLSEGTAALNKLGVQDIKFLDFKTKFFPYNGDGVEAINRELDAFAPDLILTHWPFDTHQDHRNVSLASISAARNHDNILMYEPFPPSGRSYNTFRPQVYFDISGVVKQKEASIACHKSQVEKYGSGWIESITARAKLRGFDCGVRYAEAFELLRYKVVL